MTSLLLRYAAGAMVVFGLLILGASWESATKYDTHSVFAVTERN